MNTRATTPGFCFLRAFAVAAAVEGSTLAQQEQSETQWEREHGIQHEKRLLDNKFVAVERIAFPPNNEGFGCCPRSPVLRPWLEGWPHDVVLHNQRDPYKIITLLGGEKPVAASPSDKPEVDTPEPKN
jgi:hypothetical protein